MFPPNVTIQLSAEFKSRVVVPPAVAACVTILVSVDPVNLTPAAKTRNFSDPSASATTYPVPESTTSTLLFPSEILSGASIVKSNPGGTCR